LQEDYVFYLQNLFLSKESQIFYLQCLLNYYKENKTQGILAEYYDLEDNVISNVMDAGLNVLRNEMAKSTRYLNLEERKNKETVEKIEEIAREIKVFKETNSLEKAGKDQMTSANNLLSQNTGTSTPNVSPIENNKNYNNNNSNIKDKAKIKENKRQKIESKKELIKKYEKELNDNLTLIKSHENEIQSYENENYKLTAEVNKLNIMLSNSFSEIYSLEFKLDKVKLNKEKQTKVVLKN